MGCIFKTISDWFYGSEEDISKENLEKAISEYRPLEFVPYAVHNEDMNSISAYFKDDPFYAQPLNQNLDVYVSQATGEIIGVRILNIKSIVE